MASDDGVDVCSLLGEDSVADSSFSLSILGSVFVFLSVFFFVDDDDDVDAVEFREASAESFLGEVELRFVFLLFLESKGNINFRFTFSSHSPPLTGSKLAFIKSPSAVTIVKVLFCPKLQMHGVPDPRNQAKLHSELK